ncbi:hypothetical protein D3C86_1916280 [compost metagenome]
MVRASGHWIATLMIRISGISSNGTQPKGPPTAKITPTNSNTKGRSEMVARVAEVAKSRTDSNSRNWLANEPEEAGLCSIWIERACRNSIVPSTRSAFFPARSSKCART